jgi:hypothetical protein
MSSPGSSEKVCKAPGQGLYYSHNSSPPGKDHRSTDPNYSDIDPVGNQWAERTQSGRSFLESDEKNINSLTYIIIYQ